MHSVYLLNRDRNSVVFAQRHCLNLLMGKWKPEAVERLRELWIAGVPATSIAAQLPIQVSRNAVIGKAHRLGLPKTGRPKAECGEASLGDILAEALRSRRLKLSVAGPVKPRRRVVEFPVETDPDKIAARIRRAEAYAASWIKAEKKNKKDKIDVPAVKSHRSKHRRRASPDYILRVKTAEKRLSQPATPRQTTTKAAEKNAVIARDAPFEALKIEWLRCVKYLSGVPESQRLAHDVVRQQARLAEIEAEWLALELKAGSRGFPWPSTAAAGGSGHIDVADWMDVGMLGYLGYSVAATVNLTEAHRRLLLSSVFRAHLPPLNSRAYMAAWGPPSSSHRLEKMATSIAAFARNQKRRGRGRSNDAITKWEADLSFLKTEYYVGYFKFVWPEI